VIGLRSRRRQHEGGLHQSGPRGEALHACVAPVLRIEHDAERVAAALAGRKDVELEVSWRVHGRGGPARGAHDSVAGKDAMRASRSTIRGVSMSLTQMPVTAAIIAITCVVSFLAFNNRRLLDRLILWSPAISRGHEYWRLLTSGLIHGAMQHFL